MHLPRTAAPRVLTDAQCEQFIHEGFLKLDNAFSAEIAREGRAILWSALDCDPDNRNTWTRPVVRLGDFSQEPFRQAVNQPRLHAAFDELVGAGGWLPRESLGGFPIRFPHPDNPGDTGWHVDAGFAPDRLTGPQDFYLDWRINLKSKGRALLMLFLFSDVGEEDAPTRIRVGSHLRVPELLAPAGEEGLSATELGPKAARSTAGLPETVATGAAGTVYLCHPFLVHAAQPHRGVAPRFLAQPPLLPSAPLQLERNDGAYSLVEKAILLGLNNKENRRSLEQKS